MLVKFVIVWKSGSAAQPEREQGTLVPPPLLPKKPPWEIQLQKTLKDFSFVWKKHFKQPIAPAWTTPCAGAPSGNSLGCSGKCKDILHEALKSGWVPERKTQPSPFQPRAANQTYQSSKHMAGHDKSRQPSLLTALFALPALTTELWNAYSIQARAPRILKAYSL